MAKVFRSVEQIRKFTPAAEPGELVLMEFLARELDDRYEVFFQPTMDGDKPDVVILRQRWGVAIVAVKDWDLGSYDFTREGVCRVKSDGALLPSPIKVHQYNKHLIDLYLPDLCAETAVDARLFAVVSTAVYFHRARGSGSRNVLTPWPSLHFSRCQRVLHKLAQDLELPKLTFQVIRRTIATLAQKEGTVKDVQELLRHSRVATTTDVDLQEIPERVEATVNAINAELRKLEEIQAD
jgi:hypothetical protein